MLDNWPGRFSPALLEDPLVKLTVPEVELASARDPAALRYFSEELLGCTDADEHPKPPWRKRKMAYLKHLASAPADVRRVAAADKLHNARTVLHDYRHLGERLWRRFNAGKKDQLWYYDELVRVLKGKGRPGPLVRELSRVVRELEEAVDER